MSRSLEVANVAEDIIDRGDGGKDTRWGKEKKKRKALGRPDR